TARESTQGPGARHGEALDREARGRHVDRVRVAVATDGGGGRPRSAQREPGLLDRQGFVLLVQPRGDEDRISRVRRGDGELDRPAGVDLAISGVDTER